MIYNWTELQNTKNIQKLPFQSLEKWQNWSFCKGHSKAKWSKKIYFESEKYTKNDSDHITIILNENPLRNPFHI